MKRSMLCLIFLGCFVAPAFAQKADVKFVADTLVVEAEGTYEADPDLATITFDISSQQKDLNSAYAGAADSIRKIVDIADKNKLKKEDVSTGVLTVRPYYEGDRKQRVRSFSVEGQIVLKVRDFAAIGPILNSSVENGIADLRSVTYSLSDEETAKERAVAIAMKSAIGRANIALQQNGQKIGALRYATLDVGHLEAVVELENSAVTATSTEVQDLPLTSTPGGLFWARKDKVAAAPPPPSPTVSPNKITVTAKVQCAFQIQ